MSWDGFNEWVAGNKVILSLNKPKMNRHRTL